MSGLIIQNKAFQQGKTGHSPLEIYKYLMKMREPTSNPQHYGVDVRAQKCSMMHRFQLLDTSHGDLRKLAYRNSWIRHSTDW